MTHTASLPWYDFPQTRPTLDAIWQSTRAQLLDLGYNNLPTRLDNKTSATALWADGNLLLGQCCGLNLFQGATSELDVFGVPEIAALGAKPGYYVSHIVGREGIDLPAEPVIAINNWFSHSGHTALQAWLQANKLRPKQVLETGSHRESAQAVRSGAADLAALDAFSARFIDTSSLEILAASEQASAPPFVTHTLSRVDRSHLFKALDRAVRDHGSAIGWKCVLPVSRQDYSTVGALARQCGIFDAPRVISQPSANAKPAHRAIACPTGHSQKS